MSKVIEENDIILNSNNTDSEKLESQQFNELSCRFKDFVKK